MADTEAKTNGPVDGEQVPWDPDDPEVQRQMRRPADIDQDMKEMDRRKRVDLILNSKVFREELERIIETQMSDGYTPASILALQQISELIQPHSQFSAASIFRGSAIPIADIRGVDSLAYAKGEKILRCKLAALYRLIDLLGWSQSIFNHITVRLSQDFEHFLINPYGLLFHEITASSLVKLDLQGNVLDPGTSSYGINIAGYVLHSTIHAARPDIRCILHVHLPSCVAVSSCTYGLLPLSQESLLVGDVSYHDYCGLLVDPDEKDSLVKDLGPTNKIMFLKNHGVVCCGETIEEAFHYLYHLVLACDIQAKLMPLGIENLILIPDSVISGFREQKISFEAQRDKKGDNVDGKSSKERHSRFVRTDELLFESYMRTMDNAGYRTGHIYRNPLVRSEVPRAKNDVEIPPASSAYTHIFDEDDLVRFSPLKKILETRRAHDKTRWLNSPNVYQKVELLETGTTDPKKVTKWVADGSPTHGTSFKIEGSHQFTSPAVDPQEFKRKQKELKENRMKDKVTAGPQSHILEGTTWEDVKRMQDASISGTGDQVVVVGAASKGIIQREHQLNATLYKMPYAQNPFTSVTDEEIEEYKRDVERKQRGEPDECYIVETTTVTTTVHTNEGDVSPHAELRSPQSPTSPLSEDEVGSRNSVTPSPKIIISHVFAPTPTKQLQYIHNPQTKKPAGDTAVNGDDVKEGFRSAESGENISGASRSSKEGSPTKEAPGASPKKEKKKKKGLRTPSFLKKKKDKKKNKEEVEDAK